MKGKRLSPQLTERQQLFIGILLMLLVAISMLYCLGLGSLALHQAWEQNPAPWNQAEDDYLEEAPDLNPDPIVIPNDTTVAPD